MTLFSPYLLLNPLNFLHKSFKEIMKVSLLQYLILPVTEVFIPIYNLVNLLPKRETKLF